MPPCGPTCTVHDNPSPNSKGYVNLGLTHYHLEAIARPLVRKAAWPSPRSTTNAHPCTATTRSHVSSSTSSSRGPGELPPPPRPRQGGEKRSSASMSRLRRRRRHGADEHERHPQAVVAGLDGGVASASSLPSACRTCVARAYMTERREPSTRASPWPPCVGDGHVPAGRPQPACEFYPASYAKQPHLDRRRDVVAVDMALMVDFSRTIACGARPPHGGAATAGRLNRHDERLLAQRQKELTIMTSARNFAAPLRLVHRAGAAGEQPSADPGTYADFVITEYGIAHLRFRAAARRGLHRHSHPDLRGELRELLRRFLHRQ